MNGDQADGELRGSEGEVTWTRGAAVGNRRREQGCETSHHGPLFVEVDKQGGQPTCLYPALSTTKTSDLKSCLLISRVGNLSEKERECVCVSWILRTEGTMYRGFC